MNTSSVSYSHVLSLFCCLPTCVFTQCAMSQRDRVPASATVCQKLCQTSDQSTHRRLVSDGTGACSFVLPAQDTPFQHTDPYTGMNKDTTVLIKNGPEHTPAANNSPQFDPLIALLPPSNDMGSIPLQQHKCVEFVCSLPACVGFLRRLQFPHHER